jgi:hypothetical protein
LIKGTIHEEAMIVNVYALNVRVSSFIKLDVKGKLGLSTITVSEFNIPLPPIDHPDKKNQN